jgi:hypothetical protein
LRQERAKSFQDHISKITRTKWTGCGRALACKCKTLSSNPSPTKKQTKYYPFYPSHGASAFGKLEKFTKRVLLLQVIDIVLKLVNSILIPTNYMGLKHLISPIHEEKLF